MWLEKKKIAKLLNVIEKGGGEIGGLLKMKDDSWNWGGEREVGCWVWLEDGGIGELLNELKREGIGGLLNGIKNVNNR